MADVSKSSPPPRVVLKFLFLELVRANPFNVLQECCNPYFKNSLIIHKTQKKYNINECLFM